VRVSERRPCLSRQGSLPLSIRTVLSVQWSGCSTQSRGISSKALRLLAHAVPARRRPEFVLPILSHVVVGTTCWAGARGEAEEVVQPF